MRLARAAGACQYVCWIALGGIEKGRLSFRVYDTLVNILSLEAARAADCFSLGVPPGSPEYKELTKLPPEVQERWELLPITSVAILRAD